MSPGTGLGRVTGVPHDRVGDLSLYLPRKFRVLCSHGTPGGRVSTLYVLRSLLPGSEDGLAPLESPRDSMGSVWTL